MAKIKVSLRELYNLLGKVLSKEELEEYLLNIKCELDEYSEDYATIEVKDFYRIDLYSLPGIVNELKGILNIEKGLPDIKIYTSDIGYDINVLYNKVFPNNIEVEKSYIKEKRPYIIGALVEGIKLNEDRLFDLIQLQEKIASSFGRNRKRLAIGLHNANLIKFPVYYQLADPNTKFVPLKENREMTLKEILENKEYGIKYGEDMKDYEYYPILRDSNGKIISFPPIINSNDIGNLNPNTDKIFIDISGNDLERMIIALNAFVIAFNAYGGKIYKIKINNDLQQIKYTPLLAINIKNLSYSKIKNRLGINLSDDEIIDLLKKKRMTAKILNNDIINIGYLNYRNDIISENDIVEEILIAYGYNNIRPRIPNIYTKGELNERRKKINKIRDIMVRMGTIEIYTPVLVNKEINEIFSYNNIELINYASSNYNSIRSNLISSIFQMLYENPNYKLPLEIFEVGRVGYIIENKIFEEDRLAYIYSNYKINFTEVKSVLDRLFDELKMDYELKKSNYKFLIEGRQGEIYINGKKIGFIGELNPEINEKLEIKYPIGLFEISLDMI